MNIKGRTRFYAERHSFGRGVRINLGVEDADGNFSAAKPPVFERIEPGEYAEPMLHLSNEDAQQLMDELWRAGLRPTEGTGSAGSLAATERHLKDMQAVAFGALRKQGVIE